MTGDEWDNSHPEQCNSYVETWTEKQKREDIKLASLQLTIAQAMGVKINKRQPRLKDFLPKYIRDEDDGSSELMAQFAAAMEKQKQHG